MAVGKTTLAVGVAAALVVGGLGYVAWSGAQKRAQLRHLGALVADSTDKLKEALTKRATPEILEGIDADARALKAPRDPLLASSAEQYIVSSREIVRRRADADRLLRQAAASRRALEVHMTRGRRGDGGWFREALELKKRVEADHADLASVLKAYDEMLFDMGEIGKGLAPRIGADGLLDGRFILDVRKQGQAEAANAMRELERVRRLTP
jgi:hypothetical protein